MGQKYTFLGKYTTLKRNVQNWPEDPTCGWRRGARSGQIFVAAHPAVLPALLVVGGRGGLLLQPTRPTLVSVLNQKEEIM